LDKGVRGKRKMKYETFEITLKDRQETLKLYDVLADLINTDTKIVMFSMDKNTVIFTTESFER